MQTFETLYVFSRDIFVCVKRPHENHVHCLYILQVEQVVIISCQKPLFPALLYSCKNMVIAPFPLVVNFKFLEELSLLNLIILSPPTPCWSLW